MLFHWADFEIWQPWHLFFDKNQHFFVCIKQLVKIMEKNNISKFLVHPVAAEFQNKPKSKWQLWKNFIKI